MERKKHMFSKWRRWSVPLFISAVIFAVFGLTMFNQPHRFATANNCVAADDLGNFQNICDKPINLAVCSASGISPNHCAFIPLDPGTTAKTGMRQSALPELHSHACRSPFTPTMVPSLLNGKLLEPGCKPLD